MIVVSTTNAIVFGSGVLVKFPETAFLSLNPGLESTER
jgi:hypothetical protein